MPAEISLSDAPIIQADPVIQVVAPLCPSQASSSPNGTLYDKLGGPEALEMAVDLFYEKVLADERLKHFFEGTNMMRLVIKQVRSSLVNNSFFFTDTCGTQWVVVDWMVVIGGGGGGG